MNLLLALAATSLVLNGQSTEQGPSRAALQSVRPGTVAEHITSLYDPNQSYALYLPSTYRAEQLWPVLLLMDPRGRARIPMDLFLEAAERLGYVLVSSYNTSSDTPEDVNTPALRAMLEDVTGFFSLDPKRLYLAGFSGTARMAWRYAAQLEQHTAGIIGFCAGLPPGYRPPKEPRYVFFGASGRTDFNYEEMRELDQALDKRKITHRIESFEGGHQWGPADLCAGALEWMELQGMKSGVRAKDHDLVAEIYRQRLTATERRGNTLEAFTRYQALVDDFEGLIDSDEIRTAKARVKELEKLDTVREAAKLQDKLSRRHRDYVAELSAFFRDVSDGEQALVLDRMVGRLELRELKDRAADTSAPEEALAARRMLEVAYADLAFYHARKHLVSDPLRAIAYLELADFIHPDEFFNLVDLARAYAQRKDVGKTVELLRRANLINPLDAELPTEGYFEPVFQAPEFQNLMESLRPR